MRHAAGDMVHEDRLGTHGVARQRACEQRLMLARRLVAAIWRECLVASKGPYLFGKEPCMADAMYAPVATRFLTYNVKLDPKCAAYCKTIMAMPYMDEWVTAAKSEPDELEELDVEF